MEVSEYGVTCDEGAVVQKVAALQQQRDALQNAIRWALGEHETDGFRERYDGDPPYWWRKELRARAAIALATPKQNANK